MLIKAADDKQPDLDALTALLARPDVDPHTHNRIEVEIRSMRAGVKGERDAAYEIDFFCRDHPNWAVLHDLRLEVDGLVAQIDHLLINRVLMFWVCETKHFAEGVSINDQGEWQRHWNGRAHGTASPVEQNRKHAVVLRRVFENKLVALPRRLGVTLKPEYRSLVLVSNEARISRPHRAAVVPGLETVIKAEQLATTIQQQLNDGNPLVLSKLIGPAELERIARDLAALHRPAQVDWAGRFGLSAEVPSRTAARVARDSTLRGAVTETGPRESPRERHELVCAECGRRVSYAVARFCWFNKARFGGQVLCMDCQQSVPVASPRATPAEPG